METKKQTGSHGGRRDGAGRKKTTAKRYGFNAPADVTAILEALPGSKSDYIIAAIRHYESTNSTAQPKQKA